MQAVKFKDGTKDIIEGMLAPFGGPDYLANKDFDGEYFSPDTNFELDWFGDWERPVLYGHGTDEALKTAVVGRLKITPTEAGLWAEAKLEESNAYKDAIADLVGKGALGWSSGSVERFYQAGLEADGHIKHFPIIEGSLVTMPSNPLAAGAHYAAKSADVLEHLQVLGIKAPTALAEPEPDEPDEEAADQPPVEDMDAISAVKAALATALTPQSLHDASVASGAECPSEHEPRPQPGLAVGAAKGASFDLDAFRQDVREAVRDAVKNTLHP